MRLFRSPPSRRAALPPLPLDARDLGRFRIAANRRAKTGGTGAHRRRNAGHGQEFRDYQAYLPGDDIRHVDWRATYRLGGRTPGAWKVRRFHAEEALTLAVAVDLRPSMRLPEAAPKLLPALWTAQAVGRLVERGDRLVCLPLAGPPELAEQGDGRRAAAAADRFAERCWRAARDLAWQAPLSLNAREVAAVLPPAAVLLVITDLYQAPEEIDALADLLRTAQRAYRQVVLVVTDYWPSERTLLARGPVRLEALEGVDFGADARQFDPAALDSAEQAIEAARRRCEERARSGGLAVDVWHWPAAETNVAALADLFRSWFTASRAIADALGRTA